MRDLPTCKDLPQHATYLQKSMITIRPFKVGFKATLVCVEVTLKTSHNVYTISSNGSLTDSGSSFGDGLFGGISWPVSRFRISEGLLLEQQMFWPHDGSTVAMSWAIHRDTSTTAKLVVRPFFSGCGPRAYRDVGFHHDSANNGGRLVWLPHVRGPKVLADTNGFYHDEPARLFDCVFRPAAATTPEQELITPGRFEFELGRRPSVLIFSMEDPVVSQRDQCIGRFLAGLMEGSPFRAGSSVPGSVGILTQPLAGA
jgi:hypothetical protein